MLKARSTLPLLCLLPALIAGCSAASGTENSEQTSSALSHHKKAVDHVLLLSIDGFHQFDFANYVAGHPSSALARLASQGTQYTQMTSSRPSDSFPGTLAMTTGGSPASTGIYYDVSWDDRLSPAGSACATRGAAALFDGEINFDDTTDLFTTINPALLPLDPDKGCTPVYPHDYLKVNTIFEVIRAHGGRTAVIDKHPSYEILKGPSGTGVDDLFTPENDVNGQKKDITKMEAYDDLKVAAVINELDGFDHTRTTVTGVPTIVMMNFQSANIGEKVAGYADAIGTPTPGLAGAFDFVDSRINQILAELDAQQLTSKTLIIVTSKHGDSPVDLASRVAIDPALVDATVNSISPGLVALNTPDTIELLWLKDHNQTAAAAAALQANAVALGAQTIYSGAEIQTIFGGTLNFGRDRRPDIIIQPLPGVIYTTSSASTKKVEHGGFSEENTHVPLVMVGPKVDHNTVSTPTDLRQVAPTVLKALGIKKRSLQAVRAEHVKRLPKENTDSCHDEEDDDAD